VKKKGGGKKDWGTEKGVGYEIHREGTKPGKGSWGSLYEKVGKKGPTAVAQPKKPGRHSTFGY